MFYITFDDNEQQIRFTLDNWCNLPFNNIRSINFSNMQLTELPNLDKLINLEYLSCHTNELRKLPNLDKLVNLVWLCCNNNNKLTDLPISIRKCKKLCRYKNEYNIPDYKYINDLPYLVNKEIEKYYYKPMLDYYNSKYL
jgi:Leucine-rich repeat (LRR) protein